nr:MAG TPA: hypothetical protein [Caudoviricetes sp.]
MIAKANQDPIGVHLWTCQRKIMEIIQLIRLMPALRRAGISVLMRLQEGIMMIDLTGKNVFVRTREEYLSVLKIARFQGFKWARENHLNHIEIPFPNILIFYDNKIATYSFEKELLEASKIVEDEEEIKDAVKLVRTFAKYPDRTALTDSFIQSLKLLADTVESQMEEVK